MPAEKAVITKTRQAMQRALIKICAAKEKQTRVPRRPTKKLPKQSRAVVEAEPIPRNILIDKRGFLLLSEQLLRNNIMPSEPISDLCYDVITTFRGVNGQVKNMRVQVRSTCQHATGRSLKFPILRSKRAKEFFTKHPQTRCSRRFRAVDLDAFAFVQPDRGLFFVVPAAHVDFTKTKFTVRVGDKWHEAWHYLKPL